MYIFGIVAYGSGRWHAMGTSGLGAKSNRFSHHLSSELICVAGLCLKRLAGLSDAAYGSVAHSKYKRRCLGMLNTSQPRIALGIFSPVD